MQERSTSLPKIAVLLAAYNGMRWLPEQLDSILNQKNVSISLFISVDRSSDGTEEWVTQYTKSDEHVIALPHGEAFGSAGRNFFRLLRDVDFQNFDYVSFSDQDDVWLDDKLARAHELTLSKGHDAYSSNVMAFWPSGRKVLIKKSQPQRRWDYLFEGAGPGCTYMLKAPLAREIQSWLKANWSAVQEVSLHDWFVYAFARSHGYRWYIDDHIGMFYRQHEENLVGANIGWRAFRYRVRKVLSGWGIGQTTLIARLVGVANDPFVKSWIGKGRQGLFRLILNAGYCRRRLRDRLLFVFSCLGLCITANDFLNEQKK